MMCEQLVDFKSTLSEMIYDQPRSKVIYAMNIVHSLYDRGVNIIHHKEAGQWYEYDSPSDLLAVYGISKEDTYNNPLRYLKNQFKFLSRKLAWIDKGMQK